MLPSTDVNRFTDFKTSHLIKIANMRKRPQTATNYNPSNREKPEQTANRKVITTPNRFAKLTVEGTNQKQSQPSSIKPCQDCEHRILGFKNKDVISGSVSSSSILPFIEKRLASATCVERKTESRCKTARVPQQKLSQNRVNRLPKVKLNQGPKLNRKIYSPNKFLQNLSLEDLQKTNLLNSPYLECFTEVLGSQLKDINGYENGSGDAGLTKAYKPQRFAPDVLPRIETPSTPVAHSISSSFLKNICTFNSKKRIFFTSIENKDSQRTLKLDTSEKKRYCKPVSLQHLSASEEALCASILKDLKEQLKKTELVSKGKTVTNKRKKKKNPCVDRIAPSKKSEESNKKKKISVKKAVIKNPNQLKQSEIKIPQRPIKAPSTKPGTAPEVKNRLTRQLQRMRTLCQHYDRSKYWSTEVRNYYEWNTFCLMRRYKNDSDNLKEQIKQLGRDKYEIDELWKEAVIFHDRIQIEKAAAAAGRSKTTEARNENVGIRNMMYSEDEGSNQKDEVQKQKQQMSKSSLKNTSTKFLVPPPRTPALAFLVPKLFHNVNISNIKSHSRSRPLLFEQVLTKSKKSMEQEKCRSRTAIPSASRDGSKRRLGLQTVLEKNLHKEPQYWDKSDVFEIVTSYIPETKSTGNRQIPKTSNNRGKSRA